MFLHQIKVRLPVSFMEATPEKLKIIYNKDRSDGMPKKCLDIGLSKKYGWKPTNNLDYGFDLTFRDFLKNR